LALQVELGECANEWRGFKFWSNDQEPRKKATKQGKTATGKPARHLVEHNPLLEEYVDCLHFILSIGIELRMNIEDINVALEDFSKWVNIEKQFNYIFHLVSYLPLTVTTRDINEIYYKSLVTNFVGLGQLLGFTWEEVEEAYFNKNKINHERQANGY
jgi:dimeric dUTPase (all-alpha-NTP-PPase superfamily)